MLRFCQKGEGFALIFPVRFPFQVGNYYSRGENEASPTRVSPKDVPNWCELLKKLETLEQENKELIEKNSHLNNHIKGVFHFCFLMALLH